MYPIPTIYIKLVMKGPLSHDLQKGLQCHPEYPLSLDSQQGRRTMMDSGPLFYYQVFI